MADDVRAVGEVDDVHGAPLIVGVWHGHVNIAGRMLDGEQAEEFARLFVAACWEAARDDAAMTDAQRAELKAAAQEMCLADCGGKVHDEACGASGG